MLYNFVNKRFFALQREADVRFFVACEQALFWGIVHEWQSNKSKWQSCKRVDEGEPATMTVFAARFRDSAACAQDPKRELTRRLMSQSPP